MLFENLFDSPAYRNSIHSFLFLFILMVLGLGACDSPTETDENQPVLPDPVEPFSHKEDPGKSNEDFLTNETFNRLIVEIDYMPDMKPDPDAIQNLQTFLETWLQKVEIVIQEPGEIESGDQEKYSADHVRDLEEQHRDTFSEPENGILAAYNIIVDGEYEEGDVLGIAYYNTSNAFFGQTIREVSGSPPLDPSREKIESTVFRHEFGHLFGLVDNETDMQREHHDQDNEAHCTTESCLMYWAVRTGDFFANTLEGDAPPELDEYCIEDIRAVQSQ